MLKKNLHSLVRRYPAVVTGNFIGLVAALCTIVVLSHYIHAAKANPAVELKKE